MIKYEVWLLGYGEYDEVTDYEQFLQEFSNKEDAVNYAGSIGSLKEVCGSNPIGTKDGCERTIKSVRIVVEKCEIYLSADDASIVESSECTDVVYEADAVEVNGGKKENE